MNIYICGPMTGIKEHNFPAFLDAENVIRAKFPKAIIYNPARVNVDNTSWEAAMREDIKLLVKCDTICLLDGWEKSKGARLEKRIAQSLNMKVWEEKELI